DLARPVGETLRRAEDRPRPLAVGDPAPDHLGAVGGIDFLVVGVVQLALVHVEPDDRALAWRLRHRACRTLCHLVTPSSDSRGLPRPSRSPNSAAAYRRPIPSAAAAGPGAMAGGRNSRAPRPSSDPSR